MMILDTITLLAALLFGMAGAYSAERAHGRIRDLEARLAEVEVEVEGE